MSTLRLHRLDSNQPASAEFGVLPTGVAPGVYTNPSITVDKYGRITFATSGRDKSFALQAQHPLQITSLFPQTISIASASTAKAGVVQLSDTVSSTSAALAATARSVKETYDLAKGARDTAEYALSKFTQVEKSASTAQITADNAQITAGISQAVANGVLEKITALEKAMNDLTEKVNKLAQ